MSRKSIVLLLAPSLVLFVAGSAFASGLSGTVTSSKKESQMALPEDVPLIGAQVIIGKDLDLNVGGTGADTIRGKVAVKTATNAHGKFPPICQTASTQSLCGKSDIHLQPAA